MTLWTVGRCPRGCYMKKLRELPVSCEYHAVDRSGSEGDQEDQGDHQDPIGNHRDPGI